MFTRRDAIYTVLLGFVMATCINTSSPETLPPPQAIDFVAGSPEWAESESKKEWSESCKALVANINNALANRKDDFPYEVSLDSRIRDQLPPEEYKQIVSSIIHLFRKKGWEVEYVPLKWYDCSFDDESLIFNKEKQ